VDPEAAEAAKVTTGVVVAKVTTGAIIRINKSASWVVRPTLLKVKRRSLIFA
jgi:hypothetical protein